MKIRNGVTFIPIQEHMMEVYVQLSIYVLYFIFKYVYYTPNLVTYDLNKYLS